MALSDLRARVLAAVCDTFVPVIDRDDPDGFFRRGPGDILLPQILAGAIAMSPEEDQRQLEGLLDLMASPAVGFLELAPAVREQVLLAWQRSPVAELRAAYGALAGLVLGFYYGYAAEGFTNPSWKSMGYPGPLSPPPLIDRPIRPLVVTEDTVLDCDTVVVGSGAGGGVVAGELAEAGQDVIVVEKGPYVAEDGFTQREVEMTALLYERGGALTTKNKAIAVLAGSCLGGGTTVNWSGALRTPDYVRAEWAHEHGNPQFLSPDYDASLEAIERAGHVDTDETHLDAKARKLIAGCEALGHVYKLYPRNVKGCDPDVCGYCNLGCQRGAKQGTLKTYLQRAHDRGARILVGTEVSRVIVEAGAARGVEAIQTGAGGSHRVSIRARRVVVAAGSIHTPALLVRSGLRHDQIGRNLYIHPATGVPARYPDAIRAWSGSMMPVSCDAFARIDGNYGFKIVNGPLHPMWLAGVPWLGGADHKERMLDSARIASFGAFVRERDTGRIEVDASGRPVVDYWPSDYDMGHLIRGVTEAARLHLAAGAEVIYLPGSTVFETSAGQARLEEALAGLPAHAFQPHGLFMLTAHQMGTCRMGGDAARHPVTPEGETREVEGLFVADASVFPTCSGANPMPTVMATAHLTAQGIKARS